MPSARSALTVGAVVLVLLVGVFASMPTADDGALAAEPEEPTDTGPTGQGVTVAVVDTGIDDGHAALEGRVVERIDLTDDGNGAGRGVDEHGHGTHVAGIVAGSGAGEGNPGVAPGADLVDVRVLSEEGEGDAERIAEGIEYAVAEADADVVVLSLEVGGLDDEPIAEAVSWATDRGVVVVASAGNGGATRSITTPGASPDLLSVGATARDGSILPTSSRGPTDEGRLKPDLVAPGESIPGPVAGTEDAYATRTGTSVAAPQVAGAAALLLEEDPTLTPREVEGRLASTARAVEGADAYAAGAGELDVEAALDPDVVVGEGAIDVGLVEDDDRVTKTVTIENLDDRAHHLSLDARATALDGGTDSADSEASDGIDGDGVLTVNRSEVTLAPGERTAVELAVDGNVTAGVYAGTLEYAVDGESRSMPVGFVRGGTVTVEKQPLSEDDRVDGDPLFFFAEDGIHSGIQDFEDGKTSFVAGGGTYVLWSEGVDEETGSIVFLSERIEGDGERRVVLDEADTLATGLDVGPIEAEYGPLANRTVAASMNTPAGGETKRLSRTLLDADNRTVRVSEDPENEVAITYQLTPAAAGPGLDADDVFQLHHETTSDRWAVPVEIGPEDLETTEYRLYRTTQDGPLEAQDRTTTRLAWNDPARYWLDLGTRGSQRVHRTTDGAYHERDVRGDGWRVAVDDRGVDQVDVMAHPLVAVVEAVSIRDGAATVEGEPLADGAGTTVRPPGAHSLSVAVDGAVVAEREEAESELAVRDVPVDADGTLAVRLEGRNADGRLSTRTVTEVRIDDAGAGAPLVRDVRVEVDETNAAGPGAVSVAIDADEARSAFPGAVWYAPDDPGAPPWDEPEGWERTRTGYADGRLTATLEVPADATTVSLAAELETDGGRVRTMTTDAFYVGEAPNTSTRTIAGRLFAPGGTPAANDTVLANPVDAEDGTPTVVRTDEAGAFELEVPRDERYDLAYHRGEPWHLNASLEDERPAFAAIERVFADEDVVVEDTLPRGEPLEVVVVDARGEPVPDASVRVVHRAGDVSIAAPGTTDEDGRLRVAGDDAGVSLSGAVGVAVDAPDDPAYVEGTYRTNLTVDEPRTVRVELETEPPEAVLETNRDWMLEGTPVTLDASDSDVPAGAAEYRWDLTGDGAVDEVTPTPVLRHELDPGATEVTVTVVDEAGETDRASRRVRVDPVE